MTVKTTEFLYESAPRIPKSVDYWKKKGKSGKDVCIIFHDDMDGIVSAIIMKHYLERQGFNIKQYGVINYQEGWSAFSIDKTLITIALDYAEDIPGVDIYIDHHGSFSDEQKSTQKKQGSSKKTATGSAAEGIAQQLGVPFSNDTKDWIDMIDSAKYADYNVDIRTILDFDLKTIVSNPNAKLNFAATMNQLIKRSDDRTFMEVANACAEPSIYNIYRLFKIFYPKNNPNWRSGDEPDFVDDAKQRLLIMQDKTKGQGYETQGYDKSGKKIIYTNQKSFWDTFARELPYQDIDDNGNTIEDEANKKWQLKPGCYQIIGNLMYVPSGTWANALRAKAIFGQDVAKGIIPDDVKINFVLLQYGNTLQVADLRTKINEMIPDDLPKDKNGNPISDLAKYMGNLVKNFEIHLDYQDERTKSGGHWGIGSISNIFGKCHKKPYEEVKFLDLFKNKIINDISGVKWGMALPWNEEDNKVVKKPEEFNKKLMNVSDLRTEQEALIEKEEREILNYIITNNIGSFHDRRRFARKFRDKSIRKIFEIWLETNFDEINEFEPKDLEQIYFKKTKKIEETTIFNKIVDKFDLTDVYILNPATDKAKKQRKELKRIFKIIFNIAQYGIYIKNDTHHKAKKWIKK